MSATKRGATKRKRRETIITAAESLEILQSAVNYCQKAGLQVNYTNDTAHGLTLYLPRCKAEAVDGEARFVLVSD
ncbi:MAG: hypothetical protein FJ030_04385 [Chloroflexi bacterium]|nr:hypothetical protein [Chloroflexota bacterium]